MHVEQARFGDRDSTDHDKLQRNLGAKARRLRKK